MAEEMGTGVHTFYTLDGALAMRGALDRMKEGRLVIDICEMPIKCPVAPLEFAFLADYYFRQKGIRDRIEISLVTPYTGAFTKPNANRILSKVADAKGIKVVPNFAISAVDAAKKMIRTFDGRTVDYDLLCAIPPNLGPAVIDDSGLGDGAGYAVTDPRTLKSRKAERIYLLGDNTNVATSKAGRSRTSRPRPWSRTCCARSTASRRSRPSTATPTASSRPATTRRCCSTSTTTSSRSKGRSRCRMPGRSRCSRRAT